jgi:hypothetical protein
MVNIVSVDGDAGAAGVCSLLDETLEQEQPGKTSAMVSKQRNNINSFLLVEK